MTAIIESTYVFMWGALSVLMYFVGKKHGALGYIFSVMFTFLTVWYGLRSFAGLPMFEGVLGIIFRCALAGFLVALSAVCIVKKLRSASGSHENSGGE